MSSHLSTTRFLLTSDTTQPLNVTHNVAKRSVDQILNLNLRALACISSCSPPPESQSWSCSLTRALLKAPGNEGMLFFFLNLNRKVFFSPCFGLFEFLLVYCFCDKTRCLKILQERLNTFSPQRWRLFIVHKATLCTWIFGVRPQCAWSHPGRAFRPTLSSHTFTQTREPQDPFDFISQRWKWRENVKYPTHTLLLRSPFFFSNDQHSK